MIVPVVIAIVATWLATRKSKPRKRSRGFTIEGTPPSRYVKVVDVKIAVAWAISAVGNLSKDASGAIAIDRIEKALGFRPDGLVIPVLGDDEWVELRAGAEAITWGQLRDTAKAFASTIGTAKDRPVAPPDPAPEKDPIRAGLQIEIIEIEGVIRARFVGRPDDTSYMLELAGLPAEVTLSLVGVGRRFYRGEVTEAHFSEAMTYWNVDDVSLLSRDEKELVFRVSDTTDGTATIEVGIWSTVKDGAQMQSGSQSLKLYVTAP